jgi:hypothetical protein
MLRVRDHLGDVRRLEYNIKINLKELWCENVDWIALAQDRAQVS